MADNVIASWYAQDHGVEMGKCIEVEVCEQSYEGRRWKTCRLFRGVFIRNENRWNRGGKFPLSEKWVRDLVDKLNWACKVGGLNLTIAVNGAGATQTATYGGSSPYASGHAGHQQQTPYPSQPAGHQPPPQPPPQPQTYQRDYQRDYPQQRPTYDQPSAYSNGPAQPANAAPQEQPSGAEYGANQPNREYVPISDDDIPF